MKRGKGKMVFRKYFLCTFQSLIRPASFICIYVLSSLRTLVVLTKSSIRANMKGGMKNKLSNEHYSAGNLLAFIAWFWITTSGYFERTEFIWGVIKCRRSSPKASQPHILGILFVKIFWIARELNYETISLSLKKGIVDFQEAFYYV